MRFVFEYVYAYTITLVLTRTHAYSYFHIHPYTHSHPHPQLHPPSSHLSHPHPHTQHYPHPHTHHYPHPHTHSHPHNLTRPHHMLSLTCPQAMKVLPGLRHVEKLLDVSIARCHHVAGQPGVFVKLSSRSPKDTVGGRCGDVVWLWLHHDCDKYY